MPLRLAVRDIAFFNATRAAKWSGEGGNHFIGGEDLTCERGLAAPQNLALGAFIGIAHAERNGHHYVDGFAEMPPAEAEAKRSRQGRSRDTQRRFPHGIADRAGFCQVCAPGPVTLSPLGRPTAKTPQEQTI